MENLCIHLQFTKVHLLIHVVDFVSEYKPIQFPPFIDLTVFMVHDKR